ncbi:MAG: hypothetical protein L6R35_001222 [Caloplaca aegaea]|nr:MAG: hypothetical protein L6R35_001222 [Caloplaca aegaea]
MDSLTYNTTDELKNGEILATNNTFTPYHIFEHQASAHPSESVLQSKYSSKMIAFRGPGHFQHPLLSLQRYPRCFIEAWLLLLKSSALTVQSVQGNCLSGSSLSLDEVGAILMLKDMPHDQVLAWYGDSGLHDRSPASHEGDKRASKRLRTSVMAELHEVPEIEVPNLDEPEQPSIYKCTGCPKSFKSMQTWSRHEKEDHEKIYYPCMPNGAIEITIHGRECALCGQKPTEEHLRSHNIEPCTQRKHVFKRSYELKQHLESHGVAKKSKLSEILVTKWQQAPDKRAWACGFCKDLFLSLTDFHKHIAVQHYERGEDREWEHTKVILGLLSQPFVADAWQRLLASRFRVQKLSCKWKRSKTGSLQFRLELGQEPGEFLAQAALECANYDRSLLHETFRCKEPTTANSELSSLTSTSGPPVPFKSLPLRPSPPSRSFLDNHAPSDMKIIDAARSDRFDNPSPLCFDSPIPRPGQHTAILETANPDHLGDIFGDVNTDFIGSLDFDFDWHMDFPSHLCLPNDITESNLHSKRQVNATVAKTATSRVW